MKKKRASIHPGEILYEEFLKPLKISQYRLAKDIAVPPSRINEIVLGKRSISADTALRLARYFGNSAKFWMNLQAQYDLDSGHDRGWEARYNSGYSNGRPHELSNSNSSKPQFLFYSFLSISPPATVNYLHDFRMCSSGIRYF
ncbi:MAG: HigA family addiction module antidote protein [Candidatus Omnitrophica bacterium]|nr:HigA family addiction module antidote protein [Candidatus Omnitrophota bacterium]